MPHPQSLKNKKQTKKNLTLQQTHSIISPPFRHLKCNHSNIMVSEPVKEASRICSGRIREFWINKYCQQGMV